LAAALSGIGVLDNGTWVSFNDRDAETIARAYAATPSVRGRVTSQKYDMRLKHNRQARDPEVPGLPTHIPVMRPTAYNIEDGGE
jgi:hypothetical protein